MDSNIKPGDRVTFLVVLPDNRTSQGAGRVTRLSPTNQPLIQPDMPIPFGSRLSNIEKAKVERG